MRIDASELNVIVDTEECIVSTSTEWEAGKLMVSVRTPQPSRRAGDGWDRARWMASFTSADEVAVVNVRSPWLSMIVTSAGNYDNRMSGAVAQLGRAIKDPCAMMDWRQQLRETHRLHGIYGFAACLELFPEMIDW